MTTLALFDTPISIPDDFEHVMPSYDAMIDRLRRNLARDVTPKGERVEALTVELVVPERDARRGGSVRILFPGIERAVTVALPPNLADREVLDFGLAHKGIENFFLRVYVRVRSGSRY
jgi:hypothetical protein